MNAFSQARTAYASPETPVRTPRGSEAQALQRVTRSLKTAHGGGAAQYPALVRALHENRKLWALLAAHVADDANALPPKLRAQIFYLAEFTQRHSSEILKGSASCDVLIEINSSVMKGLHASAAPAESAPS